MSASESKSHRKALLAASLIFVPLLGGATFYASFHPSYEGVVQRAAGSVAKAAESVGMSEKHSSLSSDPVSYGVLDDGGILHPYSQRQISDLLVTQITRQDRAVCPVVRFPTVKPKTEAEEDLRRDQECLLKSFLGRRLADLAQDYSGATTESSWRLQIPETIVPQPPTDDVPQGITAHASLGELLIGQVAQLDRKTLLSIKQHGSTTTPDGSLHWSLNGVKFVCGDHVVSFYFKNLLLHHDRKQPSAGDSVVDENTLVVQRYRKGNLLFNAEMTANASETSIAFSSGYEPVRWTGANGKEMYTLTGFGLLKKSVAEVITLSGDSWKRLAPTQELTKSRKYRVPSVDADSFKTLSTFFWTLHAQATSLDTALKALAQPSK